jgi:hypothetical protein
MKRFFDSQAGMVRQHVVESAQQLSQLRLALPEPCCPVFRRLRERADLRSHRGQRLGEIK